MEYFRIHTKDIAYATNQPRGIFVAVWRLIDGKVVTEDETRRYWENRALFEKILPIPPFYVDGNQAQAITYFKNTPEATDIINKMGFYFEMANKYGLELYKTTLSEVQNGDKIIYEDKFQIAVIHTTPNTMSTTEKYV